MTRLREVQRHLVLTDQLSASTWKASPAADNTPLIPSVVLSLFEELNPAVRHAAQRQSGDRPETAHPSPFHLPAPEIEPAWRKWRAGLQFGTPPLSTPKIRVPFTGANFEFTQNVRLTPPVSRPNLIPMDLSRSVRLLTWNRRASSHVMAIRGPAPEDGHQPQSASASSSQHERYPSRMMFHRLTWSCMVVVRPEDTVPVLTAPSCSCPATVPAPWSGSPWKRRSWRDVA